MLKLKFWIKYAVYLILLFFLIYLKMYFNKIVFDKNTFQIHYYAIVICYFIGISIGLLLGLEHFICEITKEGRWRINLPKFILIAIPCLYFSLPYIAMARIIPTSIIRTIFHPIIYINIYLPGYEMFLQLISGYMLITSLYKYHNGNLQGKGNDNNIPSDDKMIEVQR